MAMVYAIAVAVDFAPNPVERFIEVDASTYHNISAILDGPGPSRERRDLARAVREVLEREGRISTHDMRSIWPHYMAALPHEFTLPAPGAQARDVERRELALRVGAQTPATN